MFGAKAQIAAAEKGIGERPAVRQVAGAMGRYLLSQGRPIADFLGAIV